MRLFVGVPIPEELKQKCAEIQKHLHGKLVPKDNFHFTLKFLGDQKSGEEIAKILNTIAKKYKQFSMTMLDIGSFRDIIWIGAKSPEFIALAKDIQDKLDKFHKEEHKEIIPHLTLARESKLPKLKKETYGTFIVNKFNLYESKNGQYIVLEEFKLNLT